MKKLYALAVASSLIVAGGLMSGQASATVITFGPNGWGGTCRCYDLHNNGMNANIVQEPSFLAVDNCPGGGGFYGGSVTLPETQGAVGTFSAGNIVSSLPPPAAGTRRIFICGNPPGTTPLVNFGSATVYASYADLPCSSAITGQQVPGGLQPPWMSQFQGGNGWYPTCNP